MNEMGFHGIGFDVYLIFARGMKMVLSEFELMTIDENLTTGSIVHPNGMPVVEDLVSANLIMYSYGL